ncbi:MAG: hydrolase 1, exosortase A system-associated, partial [Alphaproteobacteria bacterium]|nr:hydrolase 1, exosortase A system-associated [Alphaproteobacteria bacterium]
MSHSKKAIAYACEGETVMGILYQPERPLTVGMVLVVGGPQYRVGSHRQFVVLARFLAEQGVSVLRFDYRGMGDSSGVMQDFEQAQPDIKAAVNIFFEHNASVKKVVLWGLCDAASAIGFYAAGDDRVKGLVLLNPWVRTEQGESKAYLKEYYLKRLVSRAFW